MENNTELKDSISKFQDILNEANEDNCGFIMIPSNNGFDFHKIDEDRLHKYLRMEASYLMYEEVKKKKKDNMNLDRLYEKKAQFFNKTDDEILKIIEDDFGKDILVDIE